MGTRSLVAITCTAITTTDSYNATWAASAVSGSVSGTCATGYSGTVTRACTGTTTQPGTWGSVSGGCARTYRMLRAPIWQADPA